MIKCKKITSIHKKVNCHMNYPNIRGELRSIIEIEFNKVNISNYLL